MKSLLVLYPIHPYVEELMIGRESPKMKAQYASIYQRLISQRYPDFQIIWVLFSESCFAARPDMSLFWKDIIVKEGDIVAACGVSFSDHCESARYPDPKTILDHCPKPIEKLAVGGFHFWDCVEKVAEYAYGQGIDVMVDDDLTEFFFWKVRDRKGNPSIWSIPFSFEESMTEERERLIESASIVHLRLVRKARKGKPWLAKV